MPSPREFRTRVGIAAATRTKMVALLNRQLADTLDLQTQTKQAHWNVRGPGFFQAHLLFDKLAGQVEDYVDLLAERAGALGGAALGTARMAAAGSRLEEFPSGAADVAASIDALALRYVALGDTTRAAIVAATGAGDAATADLFTQVSRGLDAALWFLEAHLQS